MRTPQQEPNRPLWGVALPTIDHCSETQRSLHNADESELQLLADVTHEAKQSHRNSTRLFKLTAIVTCPFTQRAGKSYGVVQLCQAGLKELPC